MFSSQIIQDIYSIHPSPNSISAVPHHHLIVKFQSRVTVPHSTRTVSHLRGVSRRYMGGQGMYSTAFFEYGKTLPKRLIVLFAKFINNGERSASDRSHIAERYFSRDESHNQFPNSGASNVLSAHFVISQDFLLTNSLQNNENYPNYC